MFCIAVGQNPPHASSQSRPAQRSRGGAGGRPSAAAEGPAPESANACARKQQERWTRQFTEGSERQQDEGAPSERHSRHRETTEGTTAAAATSNQQVQPPLQNIHKRTHLAHTKTHSPSCAKPKKEFQSCESAPELRAIPGDVPSLTAV